MNNKIIILIVLFLCPLYSLSNIIDEGLSYQIFEAKQKSKVGKSEIVIIKIDPNFYNINLFSSEQYNHDNLTVEDWNKKHDFGDYWSVSATFERVYE